MHFKFTRAMVRAAAPGFAIALGVILAAILLAVCANAASADADHVPASPTGTLTVPLPASAHAAGRVGRVRSSDALRTAACSRGLDCSHPEPPCFEDEPCWRWPTMGNHRRGVVTMNGTPLVVTVRRFCRLYLHGNLDRYPFNPDSRPGDGFVPGDWVALHRCGFRR